MARDESRPPSDVRPALVAGGRVATVLVVDDESHISHVVSLKLRAAGLRVVVASDGEEAFELAVAERPDLVITDFQMPLMSGLELSMKMRQTPELARTPVMMVTARGHLLAAEELAQTNIKALMCKPFAPRHMMLKALELLGMAGAEEAARSATAAWHQSPRGADFDGTGTAGETGAAAA